MPRSYGQKSQKKKIKKEHADFLHVVQLLQNFHQFMNKEFQTLSMGLTPSGHLHIGFLTTLATALLYLKEHPNRTLIITNVENSLSSRIDKYNRRPLRFQTLQDGNLTIPQTYEQFKKRNIAIHQVHNELTNLIWKLVTALDTKTKEELRKINESAIPKSHKKLLVEKENKIFHFFNSSIQIYSFLSVLERSRAFSNKLISTLADANFARVVAPAGGINFRIQNFGNKVRQNGKEHQAKSFPIPVRIFCPTCHQLCPEWARVNTGHPLLGSPTLASRCKNPSCPKAGTHIFYNLRDDLDKIELHFIIDPLRDFFEPFKADCHIFGGDYFQLVYEQSGVRAIDRIEAMFTYLEEKMGQQKTIFGAPLITLNGRKISKSEQSISIKDIESVKNLFFNIVDFLEDARRRSWPEELRIEYENIFRWKAA